jgi:hypothetical protein
VLVILGVILNAGNQILYQAYLVTVHFEKCKQGMQAFLVMEQLSRKVAIEELNTITNIL